MHDAVMYKLFSPLFHFNHLLKTGTKKDANAPVEFFVPDLVVTVRLQPELSRYDRTSQVTHPIAL